MLPQRNSPHEVMKDTKSHTTCCRKEIHHMKSWRIQRAIRHVAAKKFTTWSHEGHKEPYDMLLQRNLPDILRQKHSPDEAMKDTRSHMTCCNKSIYQLKPWRIQKAIWHAAAKTVTRWSHEGYKESYVMLRQRNSPDMLRQRNSPDEAMKDTKSPPDALPTELYPHDVRGSKHTHQMKPLRTQFADIMSHNHGTNSKDTHQIKSLRTQFKETVNHNHEP